MLPEPAPYIVRLNAHTIPMIAEERRVLARLPHRLVEVEGATDDEALAACRDSDDAAAVPRPWLTSFRASGRSIRLTPMSNPGFPSSGSPHCESGPPSACALPRQVIQGPRVCGIPLDPLVRW